MPMGMSIGSSERYQHEVSKLTHYTDPNIDEVLKADLTVDDNNSVSGSDDGNGCKMATNSSRLSLPNMATSKMRPSFAGKDPMLKM
jgi:hypothetical protein